MIKLKPLEYFKVRHLMNEVPFNVYYAQVVVENKVQGSIYVDDALNPTVSLICHKYGMALLCGSCSNTEFNIQLRNIMLNKNIDVSKPEWLMVHPEKWNQQLEILLNGLLISYSELKSHEVGNHEFESYINSVKERFVVKWTRVNFKFNKHNYCNNIKGKIKIPEGFRIVKIDKNLFQKISGKVVPKNFWNSPDHFLKEGVGFCLLNEGTVISTCFHRG